MPTDKAIWRKILPRPISTEMLKKKLSEYANVRRDSLMKNAGLIVFDLDFKPINFKRVSKAKYSSYGGTPDGTESDIWERQFEYDSPYWGIAPFVFRVKTNASDSEIVSIEVYRR